MLQIVKAKQWTETEPAEDKVWVVHANCLKRFDIV